MIVFYPAVMEVEEKRIGNVLSLVLKREVNDILVVVVVVDY